MKVLTPEFIHKDSRRTLKQLFTDDIKQVNFYEARRNAVLGNHFHKITTEYFYILKGSVIVTTWKRGETIHDVRILNTDDYFRVDPFENHTVQCMTNTKILTFLSKPYKDSDPDIYKESQ